MRVEPRTVDRNVARIAGEQHGLITRAQLLSAGLTHAAIGRRLIKGTLLLEYRGVYRVGHRAPSVEARYLGAVLACGERALLSGLAAGHLLRLLRRPEPDPEVTVPSERRIPGITTRRTRNLDPRDGTIVRGIPVTTVARTLVDLAAVMGQDALARACHEAGVLYDTTPAAVEAVLERRPNSPGAGRLRAVMRGDVHVTLSKLERRFLDLLRERELALPRTNRPAKGRRVDCRWPEHRLTVELDSYRYHHSRYAWNQDRRREREAHARGDEFRRYTHADVFDHPGAMLRELRAVLSRRRPA